MDLLNRSASVALPSHSSLTSLVSFPLPPLDRRALLSIQTRPVLSAWTWPSPLHVERGRNPVFQRVSYRSAFCRDDGGANYSLAFTQDRSIISLLGW